MASTAVALTSHLLGGAALPGALGIVVPMVLAICACTVLSGVRFSALSLSLSVVASQVLFHTFFAVGTIPAGLAVTAVGQRPGLSTHLGHSGHVGHSGQLAHEVVVTTSAASTGAAHASHSTVGMWLAHLGAAVFTVAVLHRGERALAHLRRLASAVLTWVAVRGTAVVVLVVSARRELPDVLPVPARLVAVLARCVPRRGPPLVPST